MLGDMSNRNLPKYVPGRIHKLPVNYATDRQRGVGLDKNTMLEGSAISSSGGTSSVAMKPIIEQDNNNSRKGLEAFKEKYASLQRTVEQLRTELKAKRKTIAEAQADLKITKSKHVEEIRQIQKAIGDHAVCKEENDKLKIEYKRLKTMVLELETETKFKQEIKQLQDKHTDILISLTKKHETELLEMKKNLDKQFTDAKRIHEEKLIEKSQIIEKFKLQVAASLNEKSKERQHQIEELVKELKRVSDEAEYVKSALKNLKSTNKDCQKCIFYENKCKELSQEILQKDDTCKKLFNVCSKMETQLSQQDDLLTIWTSLKEKL